MNAAALSLFCAYGSIAWIPASPPPGFESQFAVAVVEIHESQPIAHAAVSDFELIDRDGKAMKMKRVVSVQRFDEPSAGGEGEVAYYLNTADGSRSVPWDGTLGVGTTRLRVRVALPGPPREPARYTLTVGPYTIAGACDIAWPT